MCVILAQDCKGIHGLNLLQLAGGNRKWKFLLSAIMHKDRLFGCIFINFYNSMVKSVLTYGAETWSLYEEDRRRINATEMDALRRSARISKLVRKIKEYIRGKMDVQNTILDDITRKQLI
jgi:hypothetical protein